MNMTGEKPMAGFELPQHGGRVQVIDRSSSMLLHMLQVHPGFCMPSSLQGFAKNVAWCLDFGGTWGLRWCLHYPSGRMWKVMSPSSRLDSLLRIKTSGSHARFLSCGSLSVGFRTHRQSVPMTSSVMFIVVCRAQRPQK